VRYCRPPGGRYDREAVIAASELGLTTVLWTDNSADYLGLSPHRLERRVLSRVSNGGIILMHDGVQQTIDVLPEIIEKLRSKGYRFVTLSELERER
jgi:peptidoglycan/xylan/chitin deacetylase (PgdA/CDA1 family)